MLTKSLGMEHFPISRESGSTQKKNQPKICLMGGIEAFEQKNFSKAEEILRELHNKGAFIPFPYLEYMQQHQFLTKNFPQVSFEPIPEFLSKFGKDYLKASLAWQSYLTSTTDQDKKTSLKKIVEMITLNGNSHAFTLFRKAYEADKEILKDVPKNNKIKNIKSVLDLYKNFTFDYKGLMNFWSCVDPNHLLFLCQNRSNAEIAKRLQCFSKQELDYFSGTYSKKPQLIGSIALKLAEGFPNQPFWSHLAVENGMNEGCARLGIFFLERVPYNIKFIGDEGAYLAISRYYTSQIQKQDSVSLDTLYQLFHEHAKNYQTKKNLSNEDQLKVHSYLEKAADLGNKEEQFNCALRYYRGEGGIEIDKKKARKYFKMSADQGSDLGQLNYGLMCRDGEGGDKNLKEALNYLKKSAEKGLPEAKTAYIQALDYGDAEDLAEAVKYFKKTADEGDVDSMYNYGVMSFWGESIDKDPFEAYKYFQMAAAKGHRKAKYNYAMMLYTGGEIEQNLPEAYKNFKETADLGIQLSQYNCAVMLFNGQGTEQDLPAAHDYCKKAAAQGLSDAPILLNKLEAMIEDKSNLTLQGETQNLDAEVVIQLPTLEFEEAPSDEESEEISRAVALPPEVVGHQPLPKIQEIPPDKKKEEKEIEEEEIQLRQELQQYGQERAVEHAILRAKKRAQREAAALTRHTLTVKRKDYDQSCKSLKMWGLSPFAKKAEVSSDVMAFVETIFGQGEKKINTFSNTVAKTAFEELGCTVKSKKGENSTLVSFSFTEKKILGEQRVMKLKYHNPHGHGDDNLYDALKPYLKRFLESIYKTPETLQGR